MDEDNSLAESSTSCQENTRKRCRENSEGSNDSFDAPLELVPFHSSKRSRISPSPLKARSSAQKSSHKEPSSTPLKECVVSDWDDSPAKSPIKAARNILTSIRTNDSQAPSTSSGLNEEKENLSDSFDEDIAFHPATPVLKRTPKKVVTCDIPGFPSLTDKSTQILLTVRKVEKEEGALDLTCINAKDEETVIYVQGQWANTHVDVGMQVRLIDAQKWGELDYLITNERGLLIVEPNTLVPCTSIAGTSWCSRKVILNERFKTGDTAHKAMLIGCIMHELFQIAVMCPDTSVVTQEWLLSQWQANISSSVMEAFSALNFSPKAFENELIPYAQVIVEWVRFHVPSKPCVLKQETLPTGSTIHNIHDIEENVWEPVIGVKGKIDASLETEREFVRQIEALELKTGKSGQSLEHSTQVLLYCMMLSIRYNQPLSSGSLLYLKDGVNRSITPKAMELKGILQMRNSLAYFMSQKILDVLPEPRNDPYFCGKCEQVLTCSLYQAGSHKAGASESFVKFANSTVAHLNESEREYFKRWSEGIFAEHLAERKSRGSSVADLWNIDPDTREARGNCAAHMSLTTVELQEGCVILRFSRNSSIREDLFAPGGMCTISSDTKYGIALCCVTDANSNSVSVRSERKFSLLKVGNKYHIDTYSSYSTYASTLGNVLTLMQTDDISASRRSQIIGLRKPYFISNSEFDLSPAASQILSSAKLSKGQRQAVLQALKANEYSLIEGLPGAGKTTTIAVLIRCLIASGKTVLLTSFTNSAVDTVLSKLLKDVAPNKLLRLGRVSGSSEEISALSLKSKLEKFTTEKALYANTRRILRDTPVVACTCHHTSREVLFSWRKFDVSIIDEASMVLEPVVLPALAAADRFVMVGDTRQLAPLVLERKSREDGLNVSLFERLQIHREAVTSLVEQFRMNRVISSLASGLFYEGRLVCATQNVAEATLNSFPAYRIPHESDIALSPAIDDSCVFIDTQSTKFADMRVTHNGGGTVFNEGEARVVVDLVNKFKNSGIPAEEIGVMCVYRRQVSLLKSLIQDVEVNTVDQYQGRDKMVIIWSLVWTDSCSKRCELLADARRVNVAITRAKNKMVIVGCLESMQKMQIMEKLTSSPLVKIVTHSS